MPAGALTLGLRDKSAVAGLVLQGEVVSMLHLSGLMRNRIMNSISISSLNPAAKSVESVRRDGMQARVHV